MKQHGGSAVNVASAGGLKPAPGIGFYGASEAMLISMTEVLAVEVGPTVRVNAIVPAVAKTRLAAAPYAGREAEVTSAYPLVRTDGFQHLHRPAHGVRHKPRALRRIFTPPRRPWGPRRPV